MRLSEEEEDFERLLANSRVGFRWKSRVKGERRGGSGGGGYGNGETTKFETQQDIPHFHSQLVALLFGRSEIVNGHSESFHCIEVR